MTLAPVGAAAVVALAGGYLLYGRFLARRMALDAGRPTPAHAHADGVDFVATPAPALLAQHFSAISAAGPIAGPVLAGLTYGWAPALAWILLGCVFVGAAHDFATLVASVRHRGLSVAEILRERLGRRPMALYLAFVWVALLYVIVAFTDLTAGLFVRSADAGAGPVGPAIASSSLAYLLLAAALGWAMRRFPLRTAAWGAVSLPLVAGVLLLGPVLPLSLPGSADAQVKAWDGLILAYCFVASLLPMPLLMQPRGFLGGFLLYGFLGAGLVGIFLGGAPVQYPAFREPVEGAAPLLPFLFVTIACGACSGFHGLVCSGTTARQLDRETDAPLVGYAGMLLEGLIAVISLGCVMVLSAEEGKAYGPRDADMVFASGIARFVETLGVPRSIGLTFGLLALTTFVYDTIDVCTRLGRYILQELFRLEGPRGRLLATVLTLAPALLVLSFAGPGAWRSVWPAFGTTNQLLAGLTLAGVAVWLRAEGRPSWFVALPAAFLVAMTGWSLAWSIARLPANPLVGSVSVGLALLAAALLFEVGRGWLRAGRGAAPRSPATRGL
jgi:carbon starvation protein